MATTTATTTGGMGSLNAGDFLRGLAIAVLSPVFAVIGTSLDAGSLTFDWKVILIVALSSGLGYISKNLLTPARVVINDPEMVKKVNDAEKESDGKTTKVTLTTPPQ